MSLALVFLLALGLGAVLRGPQRRARDGRPGPGLVVTLGTLYVFRGIAAPGPAGNQVNASMLPDSFIKIGYGTIAGVPYLAIDRARRRRDRVVHAMRDFRPARDLYAIGSNPEAARLAGVPLGPPRVARLRPGGAHRRPRRRRVPLVFATVDAIAGVGYELQ